MHNRKLGPWRFLSSADISVDNKIYAKGFFFALTGYSRLTGLDYYHTYVKLSTVTVLRPFLAGILNSLRS
jgi:hypothetical protein